MEADVVNAWIHFLEDTWGLQTSCLEQNEKQLRYLICPSSIHFDIFWSSLLWHCFIFIIQEVNWRNMGIILWIWSFNFSLLTRLWASYTFTVFFFNWYLYVYILILILLHLTARFGYLNIFYQKTGRRFGFISKVKIGFLCCHRCLQLERSPHWYSFKVNNRSGAAASSSFDASEGRRLRRKTEEEYIDLEAKVSLCFNNLSSSSPLWGYSKWLGFSI